jgi:outer membrane protein
MTSKAALAALASRSAFFLPLLWACQAHADQADPADFKREWHGNIGLGVASVPKYPGAEKSRTVAFPVGRLTYDRFFLGAGASPGTGAGLGVGAIAYRRNGLEVGLGLSYSLASPRQESRDPRLSGLGDVPKTARGQVFAAYTYDWFKIDASLSQDVGGKKEGLVASLGFEGRYRPTPALMLTAGPRLTWGNQQYTQTMFGITAEQSARSGLPQYTPGSGLTQAQMELGATYQISRDLLVGARASFGRLEGDAAKSPIVEKKAQNSFGTYASYRF